MTAENADAAGAKGAAAGDASADAVVERAGEIRDPADEIDQSAIGVAGGARSVQDAGSNLKSGHVEIVCAAQIRVNVRILYQPLTAWARLG